MIVCFFGCFGMVKNNKVSGEKEKEKRKKPNSHRELNKYMLFYLLFLGQRIIFIIITLLLNHISVVLFLNNSLHIVVECKIHHMFHYIKLNYKNIK